MSMAMNLHDKPAQYAFLPTDSQETAESGNTASEHLDGVDWYAQLSTRCASVILAQNPTITTTWKPSAVAGRCPCWEGGCCGEGQIIENEQHDQLVPGLRVLKPTRTAPHRTAPLSLSVCKYPFSTPELLYCNFSEHRDASVIANSGTNKIVREKCKWFALRISWQKQVTAL